jgi:hypothetical protein
MTSRQAIVVRLARQSRQVRKKHRAIDAQTRNPMAFDAALGRAIGAGVRNTKNSHEESPAVRAAGLSDV